MAARFTVSSNPSTHLYHLSRSRYAATQPRGILFQSYNAQRPIRQGVRCLHHTPVMRVFYRNKDKKIRASLEREGAKEIRSTPRRRYKFPNVFYPRATRTKDRAASEMSNMASPSRQMQEAESTQMKDVKNLKRDWGAFAQTFIRATGSQYRSVLGQLVQQPKEVLKYHWWWLRIKVTDPVLFFYWRVQTYGFSSLIRPSLRKASAHSRFSRRELSKQALDMQAQVYSALAAGNKAAIKKNCLDGLAASMLTRINTSGAGMKWHRTDEGLKAKIVSVKHIPNPQLKVDDIDVLMQQAVVKIESKQTLQTPDGGIKEKTSPEFFTLQRWVFKDKADDWKLWGLVQPTTLDNFETVIANPADLVDKES